MLSVFLQWFVVVEGLMLSDSYSKINGKILRHYYKSHSTHFIRHVNLDKMDSITKT